MTPPIELPMAAPAVADPEVLEPRVPESAEVRRFRVDGMDCAACAKTVQKTVAAIEGIASAEVSFGTATMFVAGDAPDAAVLRAVSRAGYRAQPSDRAAAQDAAPFWRRDVRAVSTSASVALLVLAAAASLVSAPRAVAEPLYLLSMAVGGWSIALAAWGALLRRSLDMNVLMALAAVGAVGIGAYAEGAWVLVLFAVGTGLEAMALERSRRSVRALMDLAPAQARVLVDGREQVVGVDAVAVGDHVVVRPGERLPLDGTVADGSSSVDQAPITGESVPVDKQPGDTVFAGTLNTTGALTITVSRASADSTLSRVAALVEDAQGSRAPAERFIDQFARVYTPLVFLTALLVATVPLAFGGELDTWTYRALALLIVACPCSLVISVPVAVVSAIGAAAHRGIVIKGGAALEELARVDLVALDKTGTLTLGLPQLRTIAPAEGVTEDEALALMAAVEARSEHPLAAAIRRAAREHDLDIDPVEDFESLPGRGAQAHVGDRALWAGGPRLASEQTGRDVPALAKLHEAGQTALALGEGDRLLATFGLADQPRPEAAELVAQLRASGVARVVMLTGDAEPVARAVAQDADVDEWRAGLLPEDKLSAVTDLQDQGHVVAMVGDGVNDAPALAAARVGVAMGAAGSDVALQSADLALMSDRLDRLPEAIDLARRARSIMRVNVIASLAVKGVFVLLAPFGLVTLVLAVAADMGMSLAVTLNAMRLLRGTHTKTAAAPEPVVEAVEEPCADACCAAPGADAASTTTSR
ncbi:MAG: Heavy metal translocating P-type ATPase [Conexibacter sp.]|nr:Heavy metal translocating P-type ATPase [Conexibacter sp.]